MSQGLLNDIETNVTTVSVLEPPSNKDETENVKSAALTKAEKINVIDAIALAVRAMDLQKSAVEDAVKVLLEALMRLNSDHPAGHNLINMTRQVTLKLTLIIDYTNFWKV